MLHFLHTVFEILNMKNAIFRHPDDIDLFVGGMLEKPVPGGMVGPTFACLIAHQFLSLKRGDRFYYENVQTEENHAFTLGRQLSIIYCVI